MTSIFGIAAFLAAIGAGIWLIVRAGRGQMSGADARSGAIFKGVACLGIVAALLVANLWPIALMVLLAAGGVTAIEIWRDQTISSGRSGGAGHQPDTDGDAGRDHQPPAIAMTHKEAAAVLGIDPDADADTIRQAHRRLIAQLHPDRGGTDYLAAKINDARQLMMDRIEAQGHP